MRTPTSTQCWHTPRGWRPIRRPTVATTRGRSRIASSMASASSRPAGPTSQTSAPDPSEQTSAPVRWRAPARGGLMSMEVERPLEPTEVISEGVQLARGSFLELLKINAICLAPAMVVGFIVTLVFVNSAEDAVRVNETTGEVSVAGGGILAGIGAILLVLVFFALASLVASIASFTTVSAAYLGHHVGWKDSLQRTFQRGGSLVLMMLAFFGVMAAPYILGALLGLVIPALGVLLFFVGF